MKFRINNGYFMLGIGACFFLASLSIDKFIAFELFDLFNFGELVRMLGIGFIGGYIGYKTGFKDALKNRSKRKNNKRKSNKDENVIATESIT